MKKANKRAGGNPRTPAKAPVTKKPAAKPKLRRAEEQAELLPVVERLAQSTEKLAQAAERLVQAAERLTEATTRDPAARAQEITTRQNPPPDAVL
jgi:hypothetical protein